MATSTRSLRWHPHDLSRFEFADVRRLRLPEGCRFDALGLDADGQFAGVCVRWPSERGAGFRAVVVESIRRWWRSLGRSLAPPLALVAPLRPPEPAAPRGARLRKLLERAMRELRGEFDRAIQRKLGQLMGDPPAAQPQASSSARSRRAKLAAVALRRAEIRQRVLAVLADGRPRARGELLADARIFEDEAPTVLRELRELRAAGHVRMQGPRGSARYALIRPSRG